MRLVTMVAAATISIPTLCFAQSKSVDRQIQEAVTPLPAAMQRGATVLGYHNAETLSVIRAGTNAMICLADDPSRDPWHVACYHKDLDPFMARGRALRATGITDLTSINDLRRSEIENGTLTMPKAPRALYTFTGDETSFDPETGTVSNAGGLYVVYLPYATEEDSGMSAVPARDRPWLMFPGEPWAHVMISRRAGGSR